MKIKVSDYIADFMVSHGITQVFTVVGGGAMHLNDSFGHHHQMRCLYNHHEQAAAMAAESYARLTGKPALLCVTSGPGAINALNGVVGAYQDSIPMLVLSGQVKSSLTVRASGLNLRTLGGQEFDIVSALNNITKYAEMVMDAESIRYYLEKAWDIATTGRQGPCWLDVPVDIQGAYVETGALKGYETSISPKYEEQTSCDELSHIIEFLANRLDRAERPVIYAGNGIRWSGSAEILPQLAKYWSIPVVTCWDSIDLMPTNSPYYVGRGGTMGDRAGNFAVQNSDLLICIGTRLNIYQVGYNVKTWARAAYTVVVDIDSEELKKKTIRVDLPVCVDAGIFIRAMLAYPAKYTKTESWLEQCKVWKTKYPVVREEQKHAALSKVNVYAFMDALSRALPERAVTVVSNGSASVVGSQSYYIKPGDRFLMNCGISSMGYGLPAAIGVSTVREGEAIICIEGDGSLMMNLQELQTVVTNRLPLKIFVINNEGYHQIRQTQENLFHDGFIGIGPESGDLGFPDFKMIASAFGITYLRIASNAELDSCIKQVMAISGAVFCEVIVTKEQKFEPKSATKKKSDGTLISPPLEDMAPFLPRVELEENMYIPLVDDA